jgi:hypothetical protein
VFSLWLFCVFILTVSLSFWFSTQNSKPYSKIHKSFCFYGFCSSLKCNFIFTGNFMALQQLRLHSIQGRAVAQAVSRWLPTSAARVRFRAACGVCGGQSSTGAGFLRVLRFPLPIIPPISPSS